MAFGALNPIVLGLFVCGVGAKTGIGGSMTVLVILFGELMMAIAATMLCKAIDAAFPRLQIVQRIASRVGHHLAVVAIFSTAFCLFLFVTVIAHLAGWF